MSMDNRRLEGRFDRKQEKVKEYKAGLPTEDEPKLPPPVEPIQADKSKQASRNDPCPCGSGKKFKKCCGK